MDAAAELFAVSAGHKVTNRVLAASAGVNHAMVNYYFGDKSGLYRASLEHCLKKWKAMTEPLYDKGLIGLEKVHDKPALAAHVAEFINNLLLTLCTAKAENIFAVFSNTDLTGGNVFTQWLIPHVLSPLHAVLAEMTAKALGATSHSPEVAAKAHLILAQCMAILRVGFVLDKSAREAVIEDNAQIFRQAVVTSVLVGLGLPDIWLTD